VVRFLFFKLEEEENAALLLHLPKLFAETAVFDSAVGLGCRLVVETVQVWFKKLRLNARFLLIYLVNS
jgi:hypothetical protein